MAALSSRGFLDQELSLIPTALESLLSVYFGSWKPLMETTTGTVDKMELILEAPSRVEATRLQDTATGEDAYCRDKPKLVSYLLETAPEYRRLCELRQKGWDSPAGDQFFQNQRRQADRGADNTVKYLNTLMTRIAQEMQQATGALSIRNHQGTGPPMILDMCAAPGSYLEYALQMNPGAGALGFSLPHDKGGHKLALETSETVKVKFLDITMLAADMGVAPSDIQPDHPHAQDFLPAEFQADQAFNLVLCDGQVLRTHEQHRAAYREGREATRLTLTQLALGLGHLRPGGTMVVLLHKLEAWDTVLLLHTFTQFASVRLFKPRAGHAKRSSFYMIATDVRSGQAEAIAAVERWKEVWKTATFDMDEERWSRISRTKGVQVPDVDAFVHEFGPELVRMGRELWKIQADALEKAPFMEKWRPLRNPGGRVGWHS